MVEAESFASRETVTKAPSEDVRAALARLLGSEEFRGSARMRAFLQYVVVEALSGREDTIRAKTIGLDVYGYSVEEVTERESVVRVDAGRLRRKLEKFYDRHGAEGGVIISLPLGSYVPVFTVKRTVNEPSEPPSRIAHRTALWSLPLLLCGLVLAAMLWSGGRSVPQNDIDLTSYYDISPLRVEAVNLAAAGRDMIFPAVDPARLSAGLVAFEAAIERDAGYFGGHAGAAQVHSTMALLAPSETISAALLKSAEAESARALELAPDAPWALSARAWWRFMLDGGERAAELSRRAAALAPEDPHVAEFNALIGLYTSDFAGLLDQSERYRALAKNDRGYVFLNVLGSAKFHLGDFPGAIAEFEGSIAAGGPFGPISVGYLIAAHAARGEIDQAGELSRLYRATWPDFPFLELKSRLFVDPKAVEQLAGALDAAGWNVSAGPPAEARQ